MKILISDAIKLILKNDEYEKLKTTLHSERRFVEIRGQIIQKAFISGIFDLDFFISQEADTLKLKNLRRCRHCGEILDRKDVCACKDNPGLREQHPFKIYSQKKLNSQE